MEPVLGERAVDDRQWPWLRPGLLASLVAMAACSTPGPERPAQPAPGSGPAPEVKAATPPPAVPPPILGAEMRWLTALFGATPVRVSDGAGGVVSLQVPLAHSFDAASNDPKPAVRAVLDRLTQSLLRQPGARLEISAPPPAARAAALRSHVTRQGIAAWRVVLVGDPGEPASVWLRLSPGQAGVKRLDDGSLPAPLPGSVTPPKPVPVGAVRRSPP